MIAACVKWLAELGEPGDERFGGISLADQAALEMALRHGELTSEPVTVVAVGGEEVESTLRSALACGAARTVRIVAGGAPLDSVDVALRLARVVAGASFVWCGDISSDRGSGSTPAFLAGALGARQALGAIAVTLGDGHSVEVVRRLDGGRREVLRATSPCVVSVEGSVARLRRAGFAATLRARMQRSNGSRSTWRLRSTPARRWSARSDRVPGPWPRHVATRSPACASSPTPVARRPTASASPWIRPRRRHASSPPCASGATSADVR